MLQQNWYNDSNRYIKWIFSNLGKTLINLEFLIVLIIFFNNKMALWVFILFYLIMLGIYYYNSKKDQNKKPLVITNRIKRLYFTLYLLLLNLNIQQ